MTTETVTKELDAVQFDVSYEGHPISARITAAALQRISALGAPSLREPPLLETFRDHQAIIEKAALTLVAEGNPRIELSAGYFN